MGGSKEDRPLGNQKDKEATHCTNPKQPWQNNKVVFKNLNTFIPISVEAGSLDTFLGTCAEYVPVVTLKGHRIAVI